MDGHRCPPFVLDGEECELMSQSGDHDYESYDDFAEPGDAAFWIPHQREERMVEFNRLTVTIDDIIARCGYPESERDRLAALHRQLAEEFLKDYRGPLIGPVPLLEETRSAVPG